MSIVSFYFPFFVAAIVLLYYVVPKRIQWYVLLAGSVFFYAQAGIGGLIIVLFTSLITYLISLSLQRYNNRNNQEISTITDSEQKKKINSQYKKKKNLICFMGILLIISIWLFLKLGNDVNYSIIVPIGISFYSLNAISYLIDINRKKYQAEINILKLLTYILYFPHIIQGPFSSYKKMSEDLFTPHLFSYDRFTDGSSRMLFGFFKKLIIADSLSLLTNNCLSEYQNVSSYGLWLCIILYSFQLYADFSGYMDIICGLSHILGISSPENFRQPYFSRSIEEFWRRWHITLGGWFKEYLFYPISIHKWTQSISKYFRNNVSKRSGKLVGAYIALFFVWTATGLWHGFTWNYLIWGYLNMFCIILSMQFEEFNKSIKDRVGIKEDIYLWRLFTVVRTFILVCLIRVFSITSSVSMAFDFLVHLFDFKQNKSVLMEGVSVSSLVVSILGMAAILTVDYLNEKEKWQKTRETCPMLIRNLLYAVMIICLILFAGGGNDLLKGFMYARF